MGEELRQSPGYRERRFTAQDGLNLYYRDYGDPLSARRPVLCLGGLARNSKDFHGFANRLCQKRRVVCPDYRGRGRSDYDPDWRNYRPEVYANDLFHLLAAANLHEVIICGVSMGGLLAMGLCVLVPSHVAAIILDDVGPEIDDAGIERIRAYVGRDHPQPDWPAAIAEVKRLFPNLAPTDEAGWRRFAEATFHEGEDGPSRPGLSRRPVRRAVGRDLRAHGRGQAGPGFRDGSRRRPRASVRASTGGTSDR
jgi:pimeloyl-ACP methyl ester carboxylesterase